MKISWERVNNSMKIRLAESDLTFSKAALQPKPVRCCSEVGPNNFWKKPKGKVNLFELQWGWGITGQRITGQSCPDWLKMTSSRTSKPKSGALSGF